MRKGEKPDYSDGNLKVSRSYSSEEVPVMGRYDVMLEPKMEDDGIILEFKMQRKRRSSRIRYRRRFGRSRRRDTRRGLWRKEFPQERSESTGLLSAEKGF